MSLSLFYIQNQIHMYNSVAIHAKTALDKSRIIYYDWIFISDGEGTQEMNTIFFGKPVQNGQ
jgi:hypothetical protein